jgi:uncharacterized protein YggL (DUF469 family)
MRKRLRKKLRVGEFIELGFTARYRVKNGLSLAALDSLLDRFILEAIEANDLYCGGGGGPAGWDFLVCANGRKSATDADRQRVRRWLEEQPDISVVFVGRLLDAWHGDDDALETSHAEHAA